MNYTYVDIGVSDFDTSLDTQQPGDTVLLVDPLAHYLDALPGNDGVKKVYAAIVDIPSMVPIGSMQSSLSVFHVPPPIITRMGFPAWVRGCNRVHEPHPAVVGLLANHGISLADALESGIVQITQCPFMTFSQLCVQEDITKIVNLKIDTEGCDHIILTAVLEALKAGVIPPPATITFERIGYATREHDVDPYGNCAILDALVRQFIETMSYRYRHLSDATTAGPNVTLIHEPATPAT